MGGDSYNPIVVYGYRADTPEELANLQRLYKTVDSSFVDLYYCSTSAYSRWEDQDEEELWSELFAGKWRLIQGFAVLGVSIRDLNEKLPQAISDLVVNLYSDHQPGYYFGIRLVSESYKEDLSDDDSGDDDCEDMVAADD